MTDIQVAEIPVASKPQSLSTSKNFNAIDIARVTAAILIVAMHTYVFKQVNETLNFFVTMVLAKIGVPFFFVTSSFFFFRKINLAQVRNHEDGDAAGRLRKYIFRMAKIYLVWSMIYSIPRFHFGFQYGGYTAGAFQVIKGFLIALGVGSQLWYVLASIVLILIVYMLHRYMASRTILIIAVGVYVAVMFLTKYSPLIFGQSDVLSALHNASRRYVNQLPIRIPSGFIFVLFGAMLAQNRPTISRKAAVLLLLMVSVAALTAEVFFLSSSTFDFAYDGSVQAYLFMVPVVALLFVLLTNVASTDRWFFPYLRRMSLLIYCSHRFFQYWYEQAGVVNNLALFLATAASSIVFAAVVVGLLERTQRFKFLGILS